LANQHTKGADKALSEQQEKFCEHFLKFGNATAAAEHAGYVNPDIQAIRLLSKPHIKQFLTRAVQARAMGFAPELMEELANMALDRENVHGRRTASPPRWPCSTAPISRTARAARPSTSTPHAERERHRRGRGQADRGNLQPWPRRRATFRAAGARHAVPERKTPSSAC
jgi:hypothetical protein